jgi:hypothetical protein
MRPERAGRDFVEEAGGHLMMLLLLPLPLLLPLDSTALFLLLVVDNFCFTTLLLLLSTFIGVMSDVIVPDRAAPLEGPADDGIVADLLRGVDDDCC